MVVHIDFALAPCRRIAGNRLAAIAKVGESKATERQLSPSPPGEGTYGERISFPDGVRQSEAF
jgi:hypothetical protein